MKKKRRGSIYVGTSNIVIPGNRQTFPVEYREKSRLHYYSTLFNSLEVNSSFYKVPRAATFEKWSQEVSPGFLFSVKLWKEITHARALDFDPSRVAAFLTAADHLRDKKGCLLIQFPGKISLDYFSQVASLLEQVAKHPLRWNVAVEFRNTSWYAGETYELLDQLGASLVLHDIPKSKNSFVNRMAGFVYLRFHGLAGDYRGSYPPEILQEKAACISNWARSGKDVFVYFNNTIGDAFANAMTLKSILKLPVPG